MGTITQAVCCILTFLWCILAMMSLVGTGPFQQMPIIPLAVSCIYSCCGGSVAAAIPV